MKTLIIVAVLIAVMWYSLKSLVRHFKGESGCCGCPAKNSGACHCNHKK